MFFGLPVFILVDGDCVVNIIHFYNGVKVVRQSVVVVAVGWMDVVAVMVIHVLFLPLWWLLL